VDGGEHGYLSRCHICVFFGRMVGRNFNLLMLDGL
jgi:hypothetical protein